MTRVTGLANTRRGTLAGMSKSIVAIAVLLAAGLGITVAVLLSGPSTWGSNSGEDTGTASQATLFEIDPADVTAITVERSRRISSVRRSEGASWVFIDGPVDRMRPPTGWPANAPRIRAALDRLARIDRVGGDVSADPGEASASITLTTRTGETRVLRVATVAVGGNVAASTGDRSGLIERAAVAPLLDEGPLAWRLTDAFPGIGPTTTSRLTIETPHTPRLALENIESRWFLRSPVSARVEADAVNQLLSGLGAANVIRFDDQDDASPFGDPSMVITAERDRRTFDAGRVDIRTERTTADIGAPLSSGGSSVRARVTLDDGSVHLVTIARSGLPRLETLESPATLIARSPSSTVAEDVYFLTVDTPSTDETLGFRRRIDTWVQMRPDGGDAEVPAETRNAIDAAVSLLTTPVGRPATVSGETGLATPAQIDLRDASGGVIDVLRAGYDAEGRPIVRAGGVVWRYSDEQAAPLVALAQIPRPELLDRAPERVAPNPASDGDRSAGK